MQIKVIGEGPLYRVTSAVGFAVNLQPIEGEDGRFHAFSDTRYRCPACMVKFTSKSEKPCPHCGAAAEPVSYLVDVGSNRGRGKCSCENFTCKKLDVQDDFNFFGCKHTFSAFVLFGHFKAVEIAERNRLAQLQPTPVPPVPPPARSMVQSIANPP